VPDFFLNNILIIETLLLLLKFERFNLLFMKKIILSLFGVCLFVHSNLLNAQTTPAPMASINPYTEAFADITNTTNWPNGFSGAGSSTAAKRWASVAVNASGSIGDGVRITTATTSFVSFGSSAGVQRGNTGAATGTICLQVTGASDNSAALALDFFMDFTGVNAGTLSFDAAQYTNGSGSRGGRLQLFWSNDGTSWTEFTGGAVTAGTLPYNITNAVASSNSVTVTLPVAFNNSATARVRFYQSNAFPGGVSPSGNRPKLTIDNISVTATAACTTPTAFTVNSTNTSVCQGFGTNITTSGSQTGVTYELYKDAIATGNTQSGNGSGLSFPVTPSSTSSYTVRTTTAGGYCATTLSGSTTVTVNALPSVTFTAAPSSVSVNVATVYTTQAGQSNYLWSYSGTIGVDYTINSGGTTSDNTVNITWLSTGSQSVSVNYTNGNGCTAASPTTANTTVNNNLAPPTLTAAVGATVDNSFTVTYTDAGAPLFSSQITDVKINGTSLTAVTDYDITTAGSITFFPAGGNSLLRTAATVTVAVVATGYNDATVSQTIGHGAVTQLVIAPQPAAPLSNGAALASQPVVTLRDQYNNTATGSSASVTASASGGSWNLGGTASVNASLGIATFAGLTAGTGDGSILAGATITFTIAGPITAVSNSFTIPAYTSSSADEFQSKNTTGTWSVATDWQSRPVGGGTWFNATLAPTSSANSITILATHTMNVAGAQTSSNLTVQAGATLSINSGGTVTMGSARTANIAGALNLNAGTLVLTGAVMNIDGASANMTYTSGTLTGATASTLFVKNNGTYTHAVTGASTIPLANWTGTPPSNVVVTGVTNNAPSNLNNNTFHNLHWNSAAQATNIALGSNVNGELRVSSTGSSTLQISSGSGVTAVNAGSFAQSGGIVFIFATSGRSLTVNGNFDMTGGTFNVSRSGQGTATTGVSLNVRGNLTVGAAATLSNTLAASTAPVNFNGTAAQTVDIDGTVAGLNVTVNNAAGINLQSDLSVERALILTAGLINTGSNAVILTASTSSIAGASASSYVNGNLTRAVAAGSSTVAFPIGDAVSYTPVSLAFGAGNTAGNVTAAASVPGVFPGGGSAPTGSGISGTKYINREWVLSSTIPTADYAATFTYINPGDVVGGANTSSLIVARNTSGVWANPGVASSIAPAVATTGNQSAFGSFYLGELGACINNNFSGTGNWTNGANWSCGAPPNPGDNITILSGANITLNTDFTVAGSFTMQTGSSMTVNQDRTFTISGTADFNGQSVTFKSDATGYGSLGQVNSLTGATNVTVERFIPNVGFRSWRLLSVPTSGSQTIRAAWQEGNSPLANNNPGFGTLITGGGNNTGASQAIGFDFSGPNTSMLSWNGTAWSNIPGTLGALSAQNAYFLYVRGDRSKGVTGLVTDAGSTTLRSSGAVYSGSQVISAISTYSLIPNLYPSAINFTGLTRSGVANNFTIWDSKTQVGNQLGRYVTFSGTNSWEPNIGTVSYPANVANTTIESGQAFFVNGGAGATITLLESAKTNGSANGNLGLRPVKRQQLRATLSDAQGELDGTVAVFDAAFSNAFDGDDAQKMGNPGTNLAIELNGKILTVEGRQPAADKDAVQFRTWNLQAGTYTLKLDAGNIAEAGVEAILEDSYSKTSTPVQLNGSTEVSFTVDANSASKAANRLRLVFRKGISGVEGTPAISIAPNPVTGGVLNLRFSQQQEGRYSVRVLGLNGQVLMNRVVVHPGGSGNQSLSLGSRFASGNYRLEVISPAKQRTVQPLLIKH